MSIMQCEHVPLTTKQQSHTQAPPPTSHLDKLQRLVRSDRCQT